MFKWIVFASATLALAAGGAWAQQPQTVRVAGTVESFDAQVRMVKYKGAEQKIVVPPDAVIRDYVIGDKAELKPGAHIAIVRALKKPDGSLEANRVNVGRGEVVPQ